MLQKTGLQYASGNILETGGNIQTWKNEKNYTDILERGRIFQTWKNKKTIQILVESKSKRSQKKLFRKIMSRNPQRRAIIEAASLGTLIEGLQTPRLDKHQSFDLGRNSYACKSSIIK